MLVHSSIFTDRICSLTWETLQTHLFLPYFLQHSLANGDMPSALSLSYHFNHLSYFPHALEVLLHHVLDEDVDRESGDTALSDKSRPLLPVVISFLQASLPAKVYLETIVQCTRKTELRSWRTLFAHLPPPRDLFEQALRLNCLKTAVGYLLVLQSFEDEEDGSDGRIEDYCVRLLSLASAKGIWDLCAELARFLIALDGSGDMLRRAIARVGIKNGDANGSGISPKGLGLSLGIPLSAASSVSSSSLSPSAAHHRRRRGSDATSGISGTTTTASRERSNEDLRSQGSSAADDLPGFSPGL